MRGVPTASERPPEEAVVQGAPRRATDTHQRPHIARARTARTRVHADPSPLHAISNRRDRWKHCMGRTLLLLPSAGEACERSG